MPKSTATPLVKQIPMFDRAGEIIPIEPEFSQRIRRTKHNDETVYSLVDIMAEFSDLASEGDVLWRRTRKRLDEAGFQLDRGVIRLKMQAKDGKQRLTDVANAETCLRIVQSIPSPKAEPIRLWLAGLGVERLEDEAHPGLATQRARQRDLARLQRAGYGANEAVQRLEIRITGIDNHKALMDEVYRLCKNANFKEINDAEYLGILGKRARELREILKTNSVRDALPKLQLTMINTLEVTLGVLLKNFDQLSNDEIIRRTRLVADPLGQLLQMVCEVDGTDIVTGQPLLKGKQS